MTGEKLQIESDFDEEAVRTDDNQIVRNPLEEKSMVLTSADVHTFCLRLL